MPKLKVWITDLGNPCEMSQRPWVVAVFNCEGSVVTFNGVTFDSIPAPDGYAEIDLPPGKYVVRATSHSWWVNGYLYGNWATDRAVAVVCCDCDACVILYAPSVQACWIPLFDVVLRGIALNAKLPNDFMRAVETIQQQLVKFPVPRFEEGERDVLKKMHEYTVRYDKESGIK